jgi:hypothetical protein
MDMDRFLVLGQPQNGLAPPLLLTHFSKIASPLHSCTYI